MNALYEAIIGIAKYYVANNKQVTFDALATILNALAGKPQHQGGRGTAREVSGAYKYAADHGRQSHADAVAAAFCDKNGNKAY